MPRSLVTAGAVAVLAAVLWFLFRSDDAGVAPTENPGRGQATATSPAAVDGASTPLAPDAAPIRRPTEAARERAGLPVTASLVDRDGGPLADIRFRMAIEATDETDGPHLGTTNAEGRVEVSHDGDAPALRLECDLADGKIRRTYERDPTFAGTPWDLGTVILDEVSSLELRLTIGDDALEGLRGNGAVLHMRVRQDTGGRRSLLAADLTGSELAPTVTRTVRTIGDAPLWIGIGVRAEFSPVTSWFHRVVRAPRPGVWTERASIVDRLVIAGRVVDERGLPLHAATVEFAAVSGGARLLRATTDADGRFLLIPAGRARGTICVRLGAERTPGVETGPGERPELLVDLSTRVQLRFTHAGEPVEEPSFVGTYHPSRREDARVSGLARFRRPRSGGLARLGDERLAAGSRIYFECQALGERMATLPFEVAPGGPPTRVELAAAVESVPVELRLPDKAISASGWTLILEEVPVGGDAPPERTRVRYRIDVATGSQDIPSILRLAYRAELTMPDGRTATGRFDLGANRIFQLREEPGAAPRLEPVP